MKLREILQEAQQNAGVPISDSDFKRFYNKCLHDLSSMYDTAKAVQKLTIVCEDTTAYYPLSKSCIGVKRVETPEGHNISTFKVQNNAIRFIWNGNYVVNQYVLRDPITSLEDPVEVVGDTVTISPAYQRAIPVYIGAQVIKKANPDGYKDLMLEFNELAGLANSDLRKITNKYKTVAVRPFR